MPARSGGAGHAYAAGGVRGVLSNGARCGSYGRVIGTAWATSRSLDRSSTSDSLTSLASAAACGIAASSRCGSSVNCASLPAATSPPTHEGPSLGSISCSGNRRSFSILDTRPSTLRQRPPSFAFIAVKLAYTYIIVKTPTLAPAAQVDYTRPRLRYDGWNRCWWKE